MEGIDASDSRNFPCQLRRAMCRDYRLDGQSSRKIGPLLHYARGGDQVGLGSIDA